MASWSEPSKLMNPIVANTIAPDPKFRDKVDFCMLDVDEFKVHNINIAQDLLLCLSTIYPSTHV